MRSRKLFMSFVLALCCLIFLKSLAISEESGKWAGVDESVVEKYAKEHGREASEALINNDQGDLLLFVFLLAGAVGGFAAGYYWRTLITVKASSSFDAEQSGLL